MNTGLFLALLVLLNASPPWAQQAYIERKNIKFGIKMRDMYRGPRVSAHTCMPALCYWCYSLIILVLTWICCPIFPAAHCFAPWRSTFTFIKPNFPRLLMSWSGLITSFCWKNCSFLGSQLTHSVFHPYHSLANRTKWMKTQCMFVWFRCEIMESEVGKGFSTLYEDQVSSWSHPAPLKASESTPLVGITVYSNDFIVTWL